MIVRLLRPWKFFHVGKILNDCPDGVANLLIRRGHAEEVKPEPKPEVKERPKRATLRA